MKGSSQVEAAPLFVLQGPRRGTASRSASQLACLVVPGFKDSTYLRSISGELAVEWCSLELFKIVPVGSGESRISGRQPC